MSIWLKSQRRSSHQQHQSTPQPHFQSYEDYYAPEQTAFTISLPMLLSSMVIGFLMWVGIFYVAEQILSAII